MDESRSHRSSGRGERNLQVGDDGDLDDMPPLQSQVRPGVRSSSSPVAGFHPGSAQSGRPGSLRSDRASGLLSAGSGGTVAAPSVTGKFNKPVYSSAGMSEMTGQQQQQQQQHPRQTPVRQDPHGPSSSNRMGAAIVTSASATQSVPTSMARITQQQALRNPSGHAGGPPSAQELAPPAPSSRTAMHNTPRWQNVHFSAGPCTKCSMCHKATPWAPRMYTHPQQWTSSQLQSMAVQHGVSASQCVCRQCLLGLMAVLATPGRSSSSSSHAGSTAMPGGIAPGGGGPVADTIQAALTRRGRVGGTNGGGVVKGNDPHRTAKRGRGTPMASDTDDVVTSDSTEADDSDDDRTFRVGGKSAKRRPPPVARQVACAYPKCPEAARHHIGKRSHPAAATLLSLSWDVIKASCDSSGRLPLCNEHHQTINQLNGPSGKGYQTKSAVRDLVGSQFRAEDYGPSFASSSSAHGGGGGGGGVSSGASKSCSTGAATRRGRKWRAIDTNTPFARALRALPKAVDRPERTYCGLVRMPVTCLLPSSHDMSLDRGIPHLAPSLSAPPLPPVAHAAVDQQVDEVSIVQRNFTRRLHGCVPVDMVTGESVPRVQLLYADKPEAVPTATNPVSSSPAVSSHARSSSEKSPIPPSSSHQRAGQSVPARTAAASTSQLTVGSAAPAMGKQKLPSSAAPASHVQSVARKPTSSSQSSAPGGVSRTSSPPLRVPGTYPRPHQQSAYPPHHHQHPHHGQPQPTRPVPVRPGKQQPWHAAPAAQLNHQGHPRPPAGPGHGPPGVGQVAGPRPMLVPADSTASPSSNYFVAGVQQHLDIPAQLTDLDIQRQEEKVRELHRKLRQAAAR